MGVEHPVEAALRADIQPLIGKGWTDLTWRQCGLLELVADQQDSLTLFLAQPVQNTAWNAFATIVTNAITDHSLPPALEGAQADIDIGAGADQANTSSMRLTDQLDRLAPVSGAGQPSPSPEQKNTHLFRSTSKDAISAMTLSLRWSFIFLREGLDLLLVLGTKSLQRHLVFKGELWLFIDILGGQPPTLHLLRKQAPFPAVGAELGGIEASRLNYHRGFFENRSALWFLLECLHMPSLQQPRLRPVVEGEYMNA